MKRVQTNNAFALLALVSVLGWSPLLLSTCTVSPGSDAVVVNAEKTTAVAVETFDAFFKTEYQNRDMIKEKLPQTHEFADTLRVKAPKWIQTARDLTQAYKNNRTPENKANLETAISVLQAAINQVNVYTTQINETR